MVARGDLGVEVGFEHVPVIQKTLISEAVKRAKPVITATQMLESMIESPVPTRAEVSDVANAVLDGSSAVMLSAESAAGKYPVESVTFMSSIISEVESNPLFNVRFRNTDSETKNITEALASAAVSTAKALDINTIVVFSVTGNTAREISKFRHNLNIAALSPWLEVLQRLSLEWGIIPVYSPSSVVKTEEMIEYATKVVLEKKIAEEGDRVLITFGFDHNGPGRTNALKIHTL